MQLPIWQWATSYPSHNQRGVGAVKDMHTSGLWTYRGGVKVSFDEMPEFILALATPLSYYPYWKGAPLENTIPPEPPNTFVDVVLLVFKALTGPKH